MAIQRLVLICPVRGVLDGVAKEVAWINAIINGQVNTIKENDLVGLISEPLVGINYIGTEYVDDNETDVAEELFKIYEKA